MARCFVTGANGFVGSRVVRRLLERGYDVTALVGADLDAKNLEHLGVEIREIELLDAGGVRRALRGGEFLIHTAACYSFWQPDPRSIYRVNAEGTQNVLRAARELRYRKIVYTSSTATLTPSLGAQPVTEENLFDLGGFQGHYKSSKVMAEVVALRAAAEGLPLVVVHPTTVVGEGDRRPTPTGTMIVHFINGHMRAYVDTILNIVDAEDVAEGHLLALETGRCGQRYILGGENLTMAEVLELLAELTGIPAPRLTIPHPILLWAARFDEWVAARVTQRPPLIEVEAALHARSSARFSSDKARKELGYGPASARVALAKAVSWFLERGYCKPRYARRIQGRGRLGNVSVEPLEDREESAAARSADGSPSQPA